MGAYGLSRFWYGLLVVWPGCFIDLLDNLVGIFTLGYYKPSWSVKWMFFVCGKLVNRQKKLNKKEGQ